MKFEIKTIYANGQLFYFNETFKNRKLSLSDSEQIYIENVWDKNGVVIFPEYSSITNIFEHTLLLFQHVLEVLISVFSEQPLLIEVIRGAKESPQEIGGINALFETLKRTITVINLLNTFKFINISNYKTVTYLSITVYCRVRRQPGRSLTKDVQNLSLCL